MTCTDPTGQLSLFGHKILPGLFNNKNVRVVASIVAAYYLGPAGGLWSEGGALSGLGIESAFAQSAIAGFASGAIASGSLKGGLQGAFSAALFYGVGNITAGGDFWSVPTGAQEVSWAMGVSLHAVAGCITSELGGGRCGSGALSAAFTKGVNSTSLGDISDQYEDQLAGLAISTVVGGTASVLGGDRFSNGARTGAFSYLFNDAAHAKKESLSAADLPVFPQEAVDFSAGFGDVLSFGGTKVVRGYFDIGRVNYESMSYVTGEIAGIGASTIIGGRWMAAIRRVAHEQPTIRACQIFCVERGHEIIPKGLFHDRSDDHQKAQETESCVPVPGRADRSIARSG